jgi:hypothetical protein
VLRQLRVVGKTLAWLLHVANPKLAATAQPRLRAWVAVLGDLAEREMGLLPQQMDVGCPGLGVAATMRVEARYI